VTVTPSVTTPGDTNRRYATDELVYFMNLNCQKSNLFNMIESLWNYFARKSVQLDNMDSSVG